MTDPTDSTGFTQPTESPTPEPAPAQPTDSGSTQSIPNHQTQAMPSGYQYPQSPPVAGAVAGPPAVPAMAGVGLADEAAVTGSGRKGGKRTGLLVGGIAAALVLGGGAVFAAQKLSGGGAQPAEVLPGDAYLYFRLDVDPSAGQKISAVRFLDKLPQVKDNLGSGDPRQKLWDLVVKDDTKNCISKLTYDGDIAPWLGDRVGVALRPGGTADEPNVALAVQVKDEGKAQDVLKRMFACGGSDETDLRMKNGYAIITPKGQGDNTINAVNAGTLAANTNFSGDMAALGEQGVMSMWFDAGAGLPEVQKLSKKATSLTTAGAAVKGRMAAAVRFDPGYIELAGVARGFDQAAGIGAVKGDGTQLANLPDDTVAALHVAGADQIVDQAWPDLKKQIDAAAAGSGQGDLIGQLESQLDVKLPDDLKVLLGKSMTVSVPDQQFGEQDPVVGAKIVSSDAARADTLVGKVEDASNASGFLTRKVDGDRLVMATTPDYASKLQAGGKLGDTDAFKAAISDPSKSVFAMYVDLDKVEKQYLSTVPADARPAVESLRAVGLTTSVTGPGEGAFSFRVVGN
ncbi:MAG: DUF3352 domain-containing protein [Humibacillus sp.]|nr:DUF3352 domain-containing protein [Humibacillus sp.]MDN5775852.1 DUF3352 domain-containing protein [Humibacillus sp.]